MKLYIRSLGIMHCSIYIILFRFKAIQENIFHVFLEGNFLNWATYVRITKIEIVNWVDLCSIYRYVKITQLTTSFY